MPENETKDLSQQKPKPSRRSRIEIMRDKAKAELDRAIDSGAVEAHVQNLVRKGAESIALSVLGLEREHWGNQEFRLSTRYGREDSPILALIKKTAATEAADTLKVLLPEPLNLVPKKHETFLRKCFREAYELAFDERLQSLIEARAKTLGQDQAESEFKKIIEAEMEKVVPLPEEEGP